MVNRPVVGFRVRSAPNAPVARLSCASTAPVSRTVPFAALMNVDPDRLKLIGTSLLGGASVVTETALLAAEDWFAVSFAFTVNVYAVLGVRPVTVAEVPVTLVARVDPLNTSYPVTPWSSV